MKQNLRRTNKEEKIPFIRSIGRFLENIVDGFFKNVLKYFMRENKIHHKSKKLAREKNSMTKYFS